MHFKIVQLKIFFIYFFIYKYERIGKIFNKNLSYVEDVGTMINILFVGILKY